MQASLTNWQTDDDVRQRLNALVVDVILNGPTRVMSVDGSSAVPTTIARAAKLPVHLVYIRNDGWTLGAAIANQRRAFELWRDDWVAILYLIEDCELYPVLGRDTDQGDLP